ncbi:hypothetical protein [Paenibacillus camelliae]|uniref:hypothetical protein n=1 Tax=Paenibacillus camelliae TaxID=512410 RepID=UPI00203D67BC|nr:hypothetical protein [Paenibacillus camelliae]MCM3633912.1 hypothetical protein [Paenibacillus camelliae]
MKKILSIMILLVFVLSACSGSDPVKATMQDYLNAVKNLEGEKAFNYIYYVDPNKADTLESFSENIALEVLEDYKIRRIEEIVKDQTYVVYVDFYIEDRTPLESLPFKVQLLDEKWKIVFGESI